MSSPYPPPAPQPGYQEQPYVGPALATASSPAPAYVRTNLGEYWKNAPNGKRNLSILGGVFLLLIIIGSVAHPAGGTSTPGNSNTPSSTSNGGSQSAPASWHTVATFNGNGQKKTATFDVGNQWKVQWSCKPSSFYGGQYNVIAEVKSPTDDSVDDLAVNTICKAGNTTGETQEYSSGTFYVDVTSEGDWSLVVQDFH